MHALTKEPSATISKAPTRKNSMRELVSRAFSSLKEEVVHETPKRRLSCEEDASAECCCSCSSIPTDHESIVSLIEESSMRFIPSIESIKERRVSFSHCDVREYKVIIGDHPWCETGLPLSLGWEYASEELVSIESYENERSGIRRRDIELPALDAVQRRKKLHKVSGFSLSYLESLEEFKKVLQLQKLKIERIHRIRRGSHPSLLEKRPGFVVQSRSKH
mmetsp:Transcript_35782/g.55051  ORF Transcript_35782/g.55051 Transcript_35782/m.55051 type:complete len:220 (+) Transcript_35782:40-699(+)